MIALEKFEKSDYDRFISWIETEEFMVQFSGPVFTFPVTHEQLDAYVNAPNRLVYKVVNKETGEVIGHAELNKIDLINSSARICRILIGKEENRGKGYGMAIINALVDIGFNHFKLHRLELGVYDFNTRAIQCYKKCGFEIEGLFRENIRVGNTYWSTYNMSRLNKTVTPG